MSISVKIVAASEAPTGEKMVTAIWQMPRYILAEINKHRMLSSNTASSRAIPTNKLIESIRNSGFIPMAWQKKHSGMQGIEYWTDELMAKELNASNTLTFSKYFENVWEYSKNSALFAAEKMLKNGLTKQIANRIIENFGYTTLVISGTQWTNFFKLRCPQYEVLYEGKTVYFRSKKDVIDFVNSVESEELKKNYWDNFTENDWLFCNKGKSEIHMMYLAELMWDAYNEAKFKPLQEWEWHIPFEECISDEDYMYYYTDGGLSDEIVCKALNIPTNEDGSIDSDLFQLISEEYYWFEKYGVWCPKNMPKNAYPERMSWNRFRAAMSTVICAKFSYALDMDKITTIQNGEDAKKRMIFFNDLSTNGHWSAFEHCAEVPKVMDYLANVRGQLDFSNALIMVNMYRGSMIALAESLTKLEDRGWFGNLKGFKPLRKFYLNESGE